MATYDYKCDCGHEQTVLKSMDKHNDSEFCEVCHNKTHRVFGGHNFIMDMKDQDAKAMMRGDY